MGQYAALYTLDSPNPLARIFFDEQRSRFSATSASSVPLGWLALYECGDIQSLQLESGDKVPFLTADLKSALVRLRLKFDPLLRLIGEKVRADLEYFHDELLASRQSHVHLDSFPLGGLVFDEVSWTKKLHAMLDAVVNPASFAGYQELFPRSPQTDVIEYWLGSGY